MQTTPVFRVFVTDAGYSVLDDGGQITMTDPKDIQAMLKDWFKKHKGN